MLAIDAILQDTAEQRSDAKKLPGKDEFIVPALDRDARRSRRQDPQPARCRSGVVTDVPVVEVQRKIESLRKNIRDLDERIAKLKEKQIVAPKDGVLPGV